MPARQRLQAAQPRLTVTDVSEAEVAAVLQHGELTLEGRLVPASNASFYGEVTLDGVALPCVYKPVRGERPLWDFPHGTLAGREVAAYAVAQLAGWLVVPPTVLGDGPFGPGMLQQWIEVGPDEGSGERPDEGTSEWTATGLVDLVGRRDIPAGWLHVLDAVDAYDDLVSLVHADDPTLRSMAVFDAAVNNADRKGGHVLVGRGGAVRGCDHGVTFHIEDKLRSVLWGWAGRPLVDADREALTRLSCALRQTATEVRLGELLRSDEVVQLRRRVDRLLRTGRHPRPSPGWPAIPWPAF